MATPAIQPVQKRYTAGSCILDVDLQPSALSQWYPQPIIENLRFQLWMGEPDGVDVQLIAEGDRTALLEISQYVSQQVRRRLTVVHAASPLGTPVLPSEQLLTPTSLQSSEPLGYVALCDLNSVLQQCEQQSAILPVELPAVSADDVVRTPAVAAANASPDINNVVSISTARGSGTRSGVRGRGTRRRAAVWASSAAAALLAVGLTTSLWTRPESSSELSATADADATLAERPAKGDPVEQDALEADDDSGNLEQGEFAQKPAKPEKARDGESGLLPPVASDSPASNPPGRASNNTPRQGLSNPPSDAATGNLPRDSSRDIGRVATAPASSSVPSSAAPAAPPATSGSSPATELEGAIQSDSEQEELAVDLPETTADETDLGNAEKITAATSSAPSVEAALPDVAASAPPPSPSQPLPSTAEPLPAAIAGAESTDPPLNDIETFSTRDRLPVGLSRSQPGPRRNDEAIDSVRLYFQTRWNEYSAEISNPLSYELQLSEMGEVVSFAALSSEAETYRDRLLSSDMPPTFPTGNQAITLRIDVLPDGQVNVSEIER